MVKRVITALLGLPFIIAILIFANNYVFSAILTIVAMISLREYFNAFKSKAKPVEWIGYIACLLIAVITIIPKQYILYVVGLTIPLLVAILFIQVIVTNMKTTVNDIIITLFGIIYVVGFLIFIPLIFNLEKGKILIWYLFITAWGSDSAAYFVGINFGKHKITPISPKKSLEGCIGGIVGAVALAEAFTLGFNTFVNAELSYLIMGAIVGVATIFSQFGDLAASTIKRYAEIKDFGNLFPGHGGMLDRIDSILFISPFLYFLFMLV